MFPVSEPATATDLVGNSSRLSYPCILLQRWSRPCEAPKLIVSRPTVSSIHCLLWPCC